MSSYNGVTIVLSRPSRFDIKSGHLLSGFAGMFFEKAISPIILSQCHVRTLDREEPWREGTKLVVLLGQESLSYYSPSSILNQQRGCPWVEDGKIFLASYNAQEAIDANTKWEASFNASFTSEDIDDTPDTDEKSTKGNTSPRHWRFWLFQDCRKMSRLYVNPSLEPRIKTDYVLCPDIQDIIGKLGEVKDQPLYIDIETDEHFYITCIGVTWGTHPVVYVVPLFNYTGELYYSEIETCRFLRSISGAICRNCVVIHNAMFDLFVFANIYHIPLGRNIYDTMLSHARLYPDTEKSLGHCGSLYTNEPYHKSEGIFNPRNDSEFDQLLRYNGKDVFVMRETHLSQLELARRLKAEESVRQVNASIYPYLTMSLFGARLDHEPMLKQLDLNERLLVQYERILKVLVGRAFNPRSNKQMPWYFHEYLRYPVVGRSKKTGKPALSEENLYKLALKHDNPVIPICIAYRGVGKQNGVLKLKPWYGSLWKLKADDITTDTEEQEEEETSDEQTN